MFDPIISESQLLASANPLSANTGFSTNPLQQPSHISALNSRHTPDFNSGAFADSFQIEAESGVVQSGRHQLVQMRNDQQMAQSISHPQKFAGQADSLAPVGASTTDANWLRRNINDQGLQTALLKRTQDGLLDRADMLRIFKQAEDNDRVSREEFRDLRQIVNGQLKTLMPEFVQNLSDKVVNGDHANRNCQGESLGNLSAGSSGSHLDKLVGKWFLGTDRPDPEDGNGEDYSYRRINRVLFKDGVSFQDIAQGRAANCYFLASLGAVAKASPQMIQDMFIDNGDNTYTVRFFRNGQAEYVTVDNALPVDDGKRVFADYRRELWVALAEKAYAQLNESGWLEPGNDTNSYRATSFGWSKNSTQQITGLNTRFEQIDSFGPASLIQALQNNQMVTLSSKDTIGSSGKIVSNHAYTLLNYNSTTGIFTVYNPWREDNDRSRVKDANPQDGKIELTWKEINQYFHIWDSLK